jgi:hypothetical protein
MFQTQDVQKSKHTFHIQYLFSSKLCLLRENVEKCGRARLATDDNIARCMCIIRWITKATDTHSDYVILTAFGKKKWLSESASVLGYTYISCCIYL